MFTLRLRDGVPGDPPACLLWEYGFGITGDPLAHVYLGLREDIPGDSPIVDIYFGTTDWYSGRFPCIFMIWTTGRYLGRSSAHLRLGLRDDILGDPLLLSLCTELFLYVILFFIDC